MRTLIKTFATLRRNSVLNILFISSVVVSFDALYDDIMIAPPVESGLIAAANDVAIIALINSKIFHEIKCWRQADRYNRSRKGIYYV